MLNENVFNSEVELPENGGSRTAQEARYAALHSPRAARCHRYIAIVNSGRGARKLLYTHNKKIYPKTKTKLYKLLSFLMPTLLKLVLGILKTGS